MSTHQRPVTGLSNAILECRGQPRIDQALPSRVWGVDGDGRKFETEATLDNLSSSGLCVSLPYRTELGTNFCALIRFLDHWHPDETGDEDSYARVVAWGEVVRSEPKPDGASQTAVAFSGHIVL